MKPDDVCLMLRDDVGSLIEAHVSVECAEGGGFHLVYVVAADSVSQLSVRVTLCGVAIGPDTTLLVLVQHTMASFGCFARMLAEPC